MELVILSWRLGRRRRRVGLGELVVGGLKLPQGGHSRQLRSGHY
jgi:hypothetical protein